MRETRLRSATLKRLEGAASRSEILAGHRRRALIEAAVEIFASKGYDSARVSEVASLAGMSQGTVYNYVQSKEDLLFMVCMDNVSAYDRLVIEATEKAAPGLGRLRALIVATVKTVFAFQEHHMVKVRDIHHLNDARRREVFAAASASRALCEELIRKACEEANVQVGNTLLIANAMIFLPNIILSRGWDLRRSVSQQEIEAFLVEFMWRGIGLPGSPDDAGDPQQRPPASG
jgi:AcrR family transcriptional regulator